jgi:hypothetical protein
MRTKKDMFYCHFLKIIRKSRSLSESSVSLFSSVVVSVKAMKSSPLLGPFGDSEFWELCVLNFRQ